MSTPEATVVSPAARASRLHLLWPRSRPVVMGVLNCTPDSFSDGGAFLDPTLAIAHGLSMLDAGADIVDVGGESTRPGAAAVAEATELDRIVPVIAELRRRRPDALLSVDSSKLRVAAAALARGADIVNDVSAARDPAMLELVRDHDAAVVLMHMRGTPSTMQQSTAYDDVVDEVHGFLARRGADAVAAGIAPDRVWLDPGIGFGKDVDGNLALLAHLPSLARLGHPVLVGPSRKSFIGAISGAPASERLGGTLAALAPAVGLDRAVVRVHDVAAAVQYLEVAVRLREATP